MEPLLQCALAGTAHRAVPLTQTPIDALLQSSEPAEVRLLLAAGAVDLYRRAGHAPRQGLVLPPRAHPDPRPLCSPAAAKLLHTLCVGTQPELLVEALGRMDALGWQPPPALLPRLLDIPLASLRPLVLRLGGSRARWLVEQNPAWRSLNADPEPDLRRWEDGTMLERLEVLRQVRARDPIEGRAWVERAWGGEPAAFRRQMVEAMSVRLELSDEPLLGRALEDRSPAVRAAAAELLARLPGSAFSARMCALALQWVVAVSPRSVFDSLRALIPVRLGGVDMPIQLRPPEAWDPAWALDGIVEHLPHRMEPGRWWALQVIGRVPLSVWEAKLGGNASELLARTADPVVVEGWTRAALLHGATDWYGPLWAWWLPRSAPWREELTRVLEPEQREALLAAHWGSADPEALVSLLNRLPRPWSQARSAAWLERVRALVARGSAEHCQPWLATLPVAATALHPALLTAASTPWSVGLHSWAGLQWQREISAMTQILEVRQQIHRTFTT